MTSLCCLIHKSGSNLEINVYNMSWYFLNIFTLTISKHIKCAGSSIKQMHVVLTHTHSPCSLQSPTHSSKLDTQVQQEPPVISLADTVVDPGAMMVETPHTALARSAVPGPHRLLVHMNRETSECKLTQSHRQSTTSSSETNASVSIDFVLRECRNAVFIIHIYVETHTLDTRN